MDLAAIVTSSSSLLFSAMIVRASPLLFAATLSDIVGAIKNQINADDNSTSREIEFENDDIIVAKSGAVDRIYSGVINIIRILNI